MQQQQQKQKALPTLPETNSSHLKMDGWNTIVSFWGPAYFQALWLLVLGSVSHNNYLKPSVPTTRIQKVSQLSYHE